MHDVVAMHLIQSLGYLLEDVQRQPLLYEFFCFQKAHEGASGAIFMDDRQPALTTSNLVHPGQVSMLHPADLFEGAGHKVHLLFLGSHVLVHVGGQAVLTDQDRGALPLVVALVPAEVVLLGKWSLALIPILFSHDL